MQLFPKCYLEFLKSVPTPFQMLTTDSPLLRSFDTQEASPEEASPWHPPRELQGLNLECGLPRLPGVPRGSAGSRRRNIQKVLLSGFGLHLVTWAPQNMV